MARFDLDNYVSVQDRIVRFWTEYPEGAIRTRLMSPPDDFTQCRYEAAISKRAEQSQPDATGYAFEIKGAVGANTTSHEENCETSAIGRALANMGYATSHADRPSREEMTKANQQFDAEPATPSWLPDGGRHHQGDRVPGGATTRTMNYIGALQHDVGMGGSDIDTYIRNTFGKQHRDELSQQEASSVIEWLKALPKVTNGAAGAGTPAAPQANDADVSWTGFWAWARERGFTNKAGVEQFVGRSILSADPVALRAEIEEKLAQPHMEATA